METYAAADERLVKGGYFLEAVRLPKHSPHPCFCSLRLIPEGL